MVKDHDPVFFRLAEGPLREGRFSREGGRSFTLETGRRVK
jgi:hypothetical protein